MKTQEKLRRAIHFDFHTMPGIYDIAGEFNAEEFARTLYDANVEMINIFARCNLGFSYYPTKVGVMYPGLKVDLLGEMIKACHKYGIKTVAYVNGGINHEICRLHPEWCQISMDGHIRNGFPASSNVYRTPCHNTGYGEHLLAEIKEIIDNYDVDGIFCDCLMTRPCTCEKCIDSMKAEGINFMDSEAVTDFAHKQVIKTVERIASIIPEGKLFHPNSLNNDETDKWQSHAEVEVLPSSGSWWNYDSFLPLASYHRTNYPNVLFMTGRFQTAWGDFGGLRSRASIEADIYEALTAGTQYSVGDHLHPNGKLIPEMYKMIGDIYKKTKLYEKYTDDAKYLAEIGIMINRGEGIPSAVTGAVRMLAELKYGFDVINEDRELSKYRLIILPDSFKINRDMSEKLTAYIKNGGKVIYAGYSCLNKEGSGFASPELDALLTYEGPDPCDSAYYENRVRIDDVQMRYSTYSSGILVKAKREDTVIADHVKSYFNKHNDGHHSFFYTPPEKKTGYASAVLDENIGYIGFNLFGAYAAKASVFHKKLAGYMIAALMPEPQLRAPTMPSTSRVTLTGTDAYKLLHVKVTFPEPRGSVMDIIEEHTVLPAGREVYVRGAYKDVRLLPDESPVASEIVGDYTKITLPEIVGYDMFLLR